MKLEWLGEYRDLVASIYRAGNAYSITCKRETLGDQVSFSPYEVQIMETVMEYEDGNKNMSWYAHKMGLSTSTYSKYVKKLVEKGLLEKYCTTNNRKNVILRVSDLGKKEYETYSAAAAKRWFRELFEKLDRMPEEERRSVQEIFDLWGEWHLSVIENKPEEVRLLRIE